MNLGLRAGQSNRGSAGFALIIVLWTLVLIAFIVAAMVAAGRTEVRIAGNLTANADTAAAANGGLWRAVFELLAPDPRQRWPLDGSGHAFTLGDCRVSVHVYDDAARINPNLASPAMLESLLRLTGNNPDTARRLAAAIGAWVGSAGSGPIRNALSAEYRAAGRDYAPPGEPLETISELQGVLGMTPGIFTAIRPHLSLFAPAEPDAAHADPVVRAALAALKQPRTGAPQRPPQPEAIFTARITAVARGPGNAQARHRAVVRIDPRSDSYQILAWSRDPE